MIPFHAFVPCSHNDGEPLSCYVCGRDEPFHDDSYPDDDPRTQTQIEEDVRAFSEAFWDREEQIG